VPKGYLKRVVDEVRPAAERRIRKTVSAALAAQFGLKGVQIVHLKVGKTPKRPRAKPKPRESSIENSIVRWCHADERKSRTRKMNGYGFNSWPDREILPPTAWRSKERRPLWLEVKRPGEEATEAQELIHLELKAAGQVVFVVHSLQAGQDAYNAHFGRF
jgi:hypothetical protein